MIQEGRKHTRGANKSWDDLVFVDVKQSILDLHKIHNNLSDEQFAKHFEKKYRVSATSVLAFLKSRGGNSNA